MAIGLGLIAVCGMLGAAQAAEGPGIAMASGGPAHASVAASAAAPASAPDSTSLRAIYESGATWPDFLAAAEGRRELWDANWAAARPDASMVERARAVSGTWRLLAVAVDRCSDSVATIPYMAALADAVPSLDLRIVHPDEARWIMEAHPTPDGRAATPTVLLLDAEYREAGCFIERPAELVRHLAAVLPPDADARAAYDVKMPWYEEDAGAATVRDLVGMLEAAAAGERRCP